MSIDSQILNPEMYFGILEKRLSADRYSVQRNVQMAGYPLDLFAMKGSWELTKVGKVMRFVLGTKMDSVDVDDIKKYSKIMMHYVLETWKRERSTGFYSKSIFCFPLVISTNAPKSVKDWLNEATMDECWLACEFPALFLLDDSQAYYSNKTPTWGKLYYNGIRNFVKSQFSIRIDKNQQQGNPTH
jgi:hypothetical protein